MAYLRDGSRFYVYETDSQFADGRPTLAIHEIGAGNILYLDAGEAVSVMHAIDEWITDLVAEEIAAPEVIEDE